MLSGDGVPFAVPLLDWSSKKGKALVSLVRLRSVLLRAGGRWKRCSKITKLESLRTEELGKCREFGVFFSPRSKEQVYNKSTHFELFPAVREWWGSEDVTGESNLGVPKIS